MSAAAVMFDRQPALCQCGGVLTELNFPITMPKAKAKWLGIDVKAAGRSPYKGTYRFEGLCCAAACKRITGTIYTPKGVVFSTR